MTHYTHPTPHSVQAHSTLCASPLHTLCKPTPHSVQAHSHLVHGFWLILHWLRRGRGWLWLGLLLGWRGLRFRRQCGVQAVGKGVVRARKNVNYSTATSQRSELPSQPAGCHILPYRSFISWIYVYRQCYYMHVHMYILVLI